MKKTNIVLIGMAGAGKSTIGVLLAKALQKDFMDTDLLIQHEENKGLQEIIDRSGIDYFNEVEESVVLNIKVENAVIATGGSVVYSNKAMNHLKKNSHVVYVEVPFDEIEQRIKKIYGRGIVIKEGQTLLDVYKERKVLYNRYADMIVKVEKEHIEDTLEKVMNELERKN